MTTVTDVSQDAEFVPLGPDVPTQWCDLVMKGGVTSGVVYPGTIHALAGAFRFARIGGTSAGAIAAALTAASEYRRDLLIETKDPKPNAPFDRLLDLGRHLGQKSSPASTLPTLLEELFQPNALTREVFDVATEAATNREHLPEAIGKLVSAYAPDNTTTLWKSVDWFGLAAFLPDSVHRARTGASATHGISDQRTPTLVDELKKTVILAVLLVGVLPFVTTAVTTALVNGPRAWLYGLLVGLAVFVIACTLLVVRAFRLWRDVKTRSSAAHDAAIGVLKDTWNTTQTRLTQNIFGLSTGYDGNDASNMFTSFLHRELQRTADLTEVLTFGHLGRRGIELRLVTTCLTLERPYVLPLGDLVTSATPNPALEDQTYKSYYFKRDEWTQYFPQAVLDALVNASERMFDTRATQPHSARAGWEYYRLPAPSLLPVVVATRMSMSFPGLFSAVPLYAVDLTTKPPDEGSMPRPAVLSLRFNGDGTTTLKEHFLRIRSCLFGDGGLTSNFPLMLFDEVVPQRPLFAVNLQYRQTIPPGQEYFLANPPKYPWKPYYTRIETPGQYVNTLIESARGWFDNTLIPLPGYSERIVNIGIPSGSGGLNLKMTNERIQELQHHGKLGGEALVRRFEANSTDAWNTTVMNAHQWARVTRDLLKLLADYGRTYDPQTVCAWFKTLPTSASAPAFDPHNLRPDQLSLYTELSTLAKNAAAADTTNPALFNLDWGKVNSNKVKAMLRYRPYL